MTDRSHAVCPHFREGVKANEAALENILQRHAFNVITVEEKNQVQVDKFIPLGIT